VSQRLEPVALAEGVWAIEVPAKTPPPWRSTRTLLVGSGGVGWWIDPGGTPEDAAEHYRALLAASGIRTLKGVILTHTHRDHSNGLTHLLNEHPDMEVLVHPAGLERLPSGVSAKALDGGRRLIAGSLLIETVATPGHASDHLALHLSDLKMLIAGDLVSGKGATWVGTPDGDIHAYLDSLAKAAALAPTTVIPSHGEVREDGTTVFAQARSHRLERERLILEAMGPEPITLSELRKRSYPGLARWAHDFAERSTLAHLLKLMREGRVMHVGDDTSGPYLRAPGSGRSSSS